jgi:hypothetical protein
MPALVDDIAAGMRPARIESWSSDVLKGRYPNARDGSTDPAEGFYDSAADASTAIAARGALVGTERRRFVVEAQALIWPDLTAGIPTVSLVDPDHSVNAPGITSQIEVDLEDEATRYEVMV